VADDVPAHFKICALLHVTAVEPIASSTEQETNGSA
jgi:hypothetical protein